MSLPDSTQHRRSPARSAVDGGLTAAIGCAHTLRPENVAVIFDIYGRFQIEVQKTGSGWAAYRKSNGLRAPYRDLVFPADLEESELERFLDDHFHEYAQPGQVVRRVEPDPGSI